MGAVRVAAPESASAPRQQALCPRYPLAQITHSLTVQAAGRSVCFGQGVMIPEAARRQAGRSPSIGVSRALQPFCMYVDTNEYAHDVCLSIYAPIPTLDSY